MNETIKNYLSEIGRKGGQSKGGIKAVASKSNGKLGGRPKKDQSKRLDGNTPRKTYGKSTAQPRDAQKSGSLDVLM